MRTFRGIITQSAQGLTKAAKILGSDRKLAEKIGANRQSIRYWKNYGLVPYDKALETSIATDGKVNPNELRPDRKELTEKLIPFLQNIDPATI